MQRFSLGSRRLSDEQIKCKNHFPVSWPVLDKNVESGNVYVASELNYKSQALVVFLKKLGVDYLFEMTKMISSSASIGCTIQIDSTAKEESYYHGHLAIMIISGGLKVFADMKWPSLETCTGCDAPDSSKRRFICRKGIILTSILLDSFQQYELVLTERNVSVITQNLLVFPVYEITCILEGDEPVAEAACSLDEARRCTEKYTLNIRNAQAAVTMDTNVHIWSDWVNEQKCGAQIVRPKNLVTSIKEYAGLEISAKLSTTEPAKVKDGIVFLLNAQQGTAKSDSHQEATCLSSHVEHNVTKVGVPGSQIFERKSTAVVGENMYFVRLFQYKIEDSRKTVMRLSDDHSSYQASPRMINSSYDSTCLSSSCVPFKVSKARWNAPETCGGGVRGQDLEQEGPQDLRWNSHDLLPPDVQWNIKEFWVVAMRGQKLELIYQTGKQSAGEVDVLQPIFVATVSKKIAEKCFETGFQSGIDDFRAGDELVGSVKLCEIDKAEVLVLVMSWEHVKKLKPIAKVKEQLKGVNEIVLELETNSMVELDAKERAIASETIMRLLLQLAAIQSAHSGVREIIPSMAKELIRLQEKLESAGHQTVKAKSKENEIIKSGCSLSPTEVEAVIQLEEQKSDVEEMEIMDEVASHSTQLNSVISDEGENKSGEDKLEEHEAILLNKFVVLGSIFHSSSKVYLEVPIAFLVKLLRSSTETILIGALHSLLVLESDDTTTVEAMVEVGEIEAFLELLRDHQCEDTAAGVFEVLLNKVKIREMTAAENVVADSQTLAQQAWLLITLALGDFFQNEGLAPTTDVIAACTSPIKLLDDNPTDTVQMVAICYAIIDGSNWKCYQSIERRLKNEDDTLALGTFRKKERKSITNAGAKNYHIRSFWYASREIVMRISNDESSGQARPESVGSFSVSKVPAMLPSRVVSFKLHLEDKMIFKDGGIDRFLPSIET